MNDDNKSHNYKGIAVIVAVGLLVLGVFCILSYREGARQHTDYHNVDSTIQQIETNNQRIRTELENARTELRNGQSRVEDAQRTTKRLQESTDKSRNLIRNSQRLVDSLDQQLADIEAKNQQSTTQTTSERETE